MSDSQTNLAIWTVAVCATAGVITRPFKLPEAVWAGLGSAVLLGTGLLPWADGWRAVGKGTDVYLFLAGMMLLSEIARREGLFDWLAATAVNHAQGSPRRLFLLIYGVGIVVTAFLSNDAAAVVLTPAVFAAAKKARIEPLPLLFACAFIANAASFVLPISNPANLVLYGDQVPPLARWLESFTLPSIVSIAATYVALCWTEGGSLQGRCERHVEQPSLSAGGWTTLTGLVLTAVVLMTVSALDFRLGLPTCVMGVLTTAIVLARKREPPWGVIAGVSWTVLPLVAGLFILVEAVDRTGLASALGAGLAAAVHVSPPLTAAGAGAALALASNLMNNLPAGLIASGAVANAHPPQTVVDALLIGVDLGPNLSITGSLATILWLTAIRREGEDVGFWRFLKVGALVTPPALILAIGARLLLS